MPRTETTRSASPVSAPIAVTPVAFARAIVTAYKRHGRDPAGALKAAQITPALLKKADGRMTAVQMETLSATAMQELDDESLSWFSRPLPWGSYGMLARASLTAPDLDVALNRWCRHHGLLTGDVTISVSVQDGVATLAIDEHTDLGPMRELCLVYLLRNAHGLASWFIDSRIPLIDAAFPYKPPPHRDVYDVLFGGAPTSFAADRALIRFDALYLREPLRRDEAAMRQMLRRALPIAVMPYRRDRLLVQRVRQILTTRPDQPHTADSLARDLNMSARTLHRQLKEEGASLQQLKDETRLHRAKDLLLRSGKPVKQVAAATGFRNEKSFVRAFKGWMGVGPGEFRGATSQHALPHVSD
ncbi:AraC family transcriptional regulator [Variovorax sp. VNK109]|uniref:AraC family transcriptional regulator n=1 Tax=Variovorax sp. VNK109 TaxID=3400919 RepID=UPI003C0F7E86